MPLRTAILYLSRRPGLRKWLETSEAGRRLASRFVAGTSMDDAVRAARLLRAQGIAATLDYLGENVASLEEAAGSRDAYLRLLGALREGCLEPNVSLKLSQFGIDLSAEACAANVEAVVAAAAGFGGFVRVDMEDHAYTDRTLALVTDLHARHGACGTVIQAYLKRSASDIEALAAAGVRVRLCKGAYLEPPDVALPSKAEVDRNYLALAERLLAAGTYPAIATHDERMIERVRRVAARLGIARDRFEFQMLYGIRRDLQTRLVADGYRLRVYVPFGEGWYPYFMRRLAERPANLLFLARNLARWE